MEGFSKSGESESESEEELLPPIEEDPTILDGDELIAYDPYEDAIDTVAGPSLNSSVRRASSSTKKSSFSLAPGESPWKKIERRMSNPLSMLVGSVGSGGQRPAEQGIVLEGRASINAHTLS